MMKNENKIEVDINKLTGSVVGEIWKVLLSVGGCESSCVGVLPALTFRIKQYFVENGVPSGKTEETVFARAAADRTEMILNFFHIELKDAALVKKEIELAVKKHLADPKKDSK